MTDDEIRRRVRERLANHTLETSYVIAQEPVKGADSPVATGYGAFNDPCVVCDERGTQRRYTNTTAAFHERCHTIWQEEVRKLPR